MGHKRLVKSYNRWIDGVIGGIGEYFEINPDFLRIGVLIAFFIFDFHFLLPAYIVMMIVMPRANNEIITDDENKISYSPGKSLQILGYILIIGGIYYLLRYSLVFTSSFVNRFFNMLTYYMYRINVFVGPVREVLIAVVLIGVGVWLISKERNK